MVMGTGPVIFNSENSKYLNSQISKFLVHFDTIFKFYLIINTSKVILFWNFDLRIFSVCGHGAWSCQLFKYASSSRNQAYSDFNIVHNPRSEIIEFFISEQKPFLSIQVPNHMINYHVFLRVFTEKFLSSLEKKMSLKTFNILFLNTILYS